MKKNGRIPKTLAKFITYIVNLGVYLHLIPQGGTDPRGITLGMTTAELAAYKAFVKLFVSGDPANPGFWDLHSNPDKKNKLTRLNMLQAMKEFGIFFRPLLNRINVSPNITNEDRTIMNIAIPKTGKREKRTLPISDLCHVKIVPGINGDIRLSFSTTPDSRASKAEGADAIEIASRIDAPADPATKIKYKPLNSANDGTSSSIHTKANFILKLGSENSGNYYQFYCRWTNTKNPVIAGSWTGPLVVLIP
jgi:hypothetical protein